MYSTKKGRSQLTGGKKMKGKILKTGTEMAAQIRSSGNASDLYSRSTWFKSTILRGLFAVFLSMSRQITEYYLKLDHDCILPTHRSISFLPFSSLLLVGLQVL
jgi:hypothetical protein